MKISFLVAFLAVSFANPLEAIVNRDGFDPNDSERWGAAKMFKSVCYLGTTYEDGRGGESTGVLISPNTVLTTAHSVRSGQGLVRCFVVFSNEVGTEKPGESYLRNINKSGIIPHPDHAIDASFQVQGVDLALLRFDEPIPVTPVALYEQEMVPNSQGYIVGFGPGGTSSEGITRRESKRRMGTTRISEVSDQGLLYNFRPLVMDGEIPDRFAVTEDMDRFQSIPVGHDSGAPLLVGPKKKLQLAGIFKGVTTTYVEDEPSKAAAIWTPVYPYLDWIKRVAELEGEAISTQTSGGGGSGSR